MHFVPAVGTFVCGISAAIAGVFGMNLKSSIEETDYLFYVVGAILFAISAGGPFVVCCFARKRGLEL